MCVFGVVGVPEGAPSPGQWPRRNALPWRGKKKRPCAGRRALVASLAPAGPWGVYPGPGVIPLVGTRARRRFWRRRSMLRPVGGPAALSGSGHVITVSRGRRRPPPVGSGGGGRRGRDPAWNAALGLVNSVAVVHRRVCWGGEETPTPDPTRLRGEVPTVGVGRCAIFQRGLLVVARPRDQGPTGLWEQRGAARRAGLVARVFPRLSRAIPGWMTSRGACIDGVSIRFAIREKGTWTDRDGTDMYMYTLRERRGLS